MDPWCLDSKSQSKYNRRCFTQISDMDFPLAIWAARGSKGKNSIMNYELLFSSFLNVFTGKYCSVITKKLLDKWNFVFVFEIFLQIIFYWLPLRFWILSVRETLRQIMLCKEGSTLCYVTFVFQILCGQNLRPKHKSIFL